MFNNMKNKIREETGTDISKFIPNPRLSRDNSRTSLNSLTALPENPINSHLQNTSTLKKIILYKHDAVVLKNSKVTMDDTGTLSLVHYEDANRIIIEWNLEQITTKNDNEENEFIMVEKQKKTDDPVRSAITSVGSCSSADYFDKKKHRQHRSHHVHRRHKYKGSSSSSEPLNDLDSGNPQKPSQAVQIDIISIKSYKVAKRRNEIDIMQKTGRKDTFHFQFDTPDEFINHLRRLLKTKRAPGRKSLYLVLGRDQKPTFSDLDAILTEDTPTNVLFGYLNQFQQRPMETMYSTFAAITSLVENKSAEIPNRDRAVTNMLNRSIDLDNDYTVVGKPIQLKPCPPVTRGDPLSHDDWYEVEDNEGRVKDEEKVKKIIFRGGIKPSLRLVWKYLLGLYPWNSTRDERDDILKKKHQDYDRMKLQWQSISKDQEERWADFYSRKSLIEKDVARTDRELPFFQGDNSRNLELLNNILMTYVMYNFDLGYVQGMSDLLSPLLYVIQDEVETFWCFVGFMERTKHNFELDQAGMKKQLGEVFLVLQTVAPDLAQHLIKTEANNMFFCFRWLLVLFKREFILDDIMTLWEVLWTNLPCKNFHILICAAILNQEKKHIIESNLGFTDVLKYVNDLCKKLDLSAILCAAEGMYLQLLDAKETLPTPLKKLIGFVPDDSESSDCESDIDNTKYPGSQDGAVGGKADDFEQGKKDAPLTSDSEDD